MLPTHDPTQNFIREWYSRMTLSSPFSPATPTGKDQYPPQSAKQQSGLEFDFVDGSGPVFSMCLEMAEEEDTKMAKSWKADADSILVFTRSFSAAVASLISVSIQDIQQDPQGTSNFYLAIIYQVLAEPNRSNITTSLPTPIFSTYLCSLGERSLVHELGHQYYLCRTCDVVTAMSTKIPQGHQDTFEPTQGGSYPHILCRRCREESPPAGGGSIAHTDSCFPGPFLCWPSRVPIKR
ncbi:hypothetical protein V8E53_001831 [Lactarius tabidus]